MKRSEFYAMFITMIVLFTASVSFAVSYQPQIIQPTKPYSGKILKSGDAAQNTYYTVVDTISGSGILTKVVMQSPERSSNEYTIKITVDGAEYFITSAYNLNASGMYVFDGATALANNRVMIFNGPLYFKSSLKVEVKHSNANASTLGAVADYALE